MNDTLHVEMQDSDLLDEIGLMAALMVAASETEDMLSQEAIDEILAATSEEGPL
jgi:hypothetical protein